MLILSGKVLCSDLTSVKLDRQFAEKGRFAPSGLSDVPSVGLVKSQVTYPAVLWERKNRKSLLYSGHSRSVALGYLQLLLLCYFANLSPHKC